MEHKQWTDLDRFVMGDIIKHLEMDGHKGWVDFLEELAATVDLKPFK